GISAKVEAAIEAGFKKVIIPESNVQDVILDEHHMGKIEIVTVSTIIEVLEIALKESIQKNRLINDLKAVINVPVVV
ncbi:MAG: S16 family serine protease, partial [Thermoplasmata archaeon]